jgi:homoserine O-acetyltransferase
MYPQFCETIIPISTAAQQPAWCIALNTAARTAIMNDPGWNNGNYERQPERGLALARMIGMISYRSPTEFDERFGRQLVDGPSLERENYFSVQSYLCYQGNKLAARFDANTYLCLTRAMDLHDIAHNRGAVDNVLRSIRARALSIGVSTDVRYPVVYQQRIVGQIPRARYVEIDSIHGHDAFLLEFGQLNAVIGSFLQRA